MICMFIFETPTLTGIRGALVPMLYSGIMSSGAGYTLQIVGQKYTYPTADAAFDAACNALKEILQEV